MSDPGKIMDAHHRIQNETSAGVPSAQRTCTGPCRKRRSAETQFDGDSTICKQCVRRTQKQPGVEMTNENVVDAHGELRRLAEAATPGPWRSSGRYIGTKNHMSYIGECRDENGNWSDTEKSTGDSAFIAAANPAAILALLDQLALLRKDSDLQAEVIHSKNAWIMRSEAALAAAPASPASAPLAIVPEAIAQRTEDIRQRMASPTSIPRSALMHYVECLLAHIATVAAPLPPAAAPAPELTRDKQDAARYRFVRNHPAMGQPMIKNLMVGNLPLDESIDAAIQAQGSDAA